MVNARSYFTGLDLGQAHEYTALAIVERTFEPDPKAPRQSLRHFAVRHLHRFTLGTAYEDMAAQVASLFVNPPLRRSRLIVDQTMVGRPVVDALRRCKVEAAISVLTLGAGHHVGSHGGGALVVPKKELVSTLQVLLQSRRLKVAPALIILLISKNTLDLTKRLFTLFF